MQQAATALEAGDAGTLGALMTEAQQLFDRHVQPACPAQLTAPVLHTLLAHEAIQPLVYGGKGVGSQGDGTAQLLARSAADQAEVFRLVEEELGMKALTLTMGSVRKVRKALIPAAGFGTRMFPATKAAKKELFPVIDSEGRAKPAILAIVEEALSAGIEEVCILVQSEDVEHFQDIFCTPPSIENFNKLSTEQQRYCDYLQDIGNRITFVTQDVQEGFGHAVYCAKEWIDNEPFLLLLGDHLYSAPGDQSCARQLVDDYERYGVSVVGVVPEPADQVQHFGCVTGQWHEAGESLSITEFAEKPTAEYAREKLQVEGLDEDSFLTLFGQYVLSPKVFEFLDENIRHNLRERGEFQLTSCLDRVRQEEGFVACAVKGQRHDIGNPQAYLKSIQEFANS